MSGQRATRIIFLAWESPWPAYYGGALRTLGLLKELSKVYTIDLVVLSRKALSAEQRRELQKYASSIASVPMAGSDLLNKLRVLVHMFTHRMPYHCALLDLSFCRAPGILEQVLSFPDVVYASYGSWGTLARDRNAHNWILDQHNADVDFWRAYASQSPNLWLKLAALANWRLAAKYFPEVYTCVGRVVAVCEEDRQLTLLVNPKARVDVIENGVDCAYYAPDRIPRSGPPRLLFTGTSVPRNVMALRQFTSNVWPLIRRQLPENELWVAGNFKPEAQTEFKKYDNLHFTGRVEDIRPYFNQSDVFIAPFEETHGSKLKIAEAMAMGMAIVSTPEGIRGFSLIDGESVLVAHTPQQFADYAITLLLDPERREQLGKAARQVAMTTIDWQVLGTRLRKIVETMSGMED